MEYSLVFPHQLFPLAPAQARRRPLLVLEDPLFFGTDRHWPCAMHAQKLVLHRASLAAFVERVNRAGGEATVLRCPAGPATTADLLAAALPRGTKALHVTDPEDDVLSRRLRRFADERGIGLEVTPSPNFLTPDDFLDRQLPAGRKPFMARFYEAQRRRMGILVEPDGTPTGGKWSFDTENRKKLPPGIAIAPPVWPKRHPAVAQAVTEIGAEFPGAPGDAAAFRYAVTPDDAEALFDGFLAERFAQFGAFEDAITTRHEVLFHSVLTPALNIGLLDPAAVVRRTLDFADEQRVPLNSVEGFVRQIIGWREFLRAMYRRNGPAMRTRNFWRFTRPMPRAFYDGTTGIAPVDHVIRQLHRTAWCHHIERLMVLGNFFLLCRIHPDAVYRWFMELFIDAYDWVMVPNVYGMSQFADGGMFTTKPYLSGSNYIRKMSDHPAGPWCAVWDALFWTFIADHRDVFAGNPRLSMMAKTCDRLGEKLTAHRRVADGFLERLFAA